MELKKVTDLNCKNKIVFLRLTLPKSLSQHKESSSFEGNIPLETLKYLINEGCHVVVAAHYGQLNGQVDSNYSLESLGYYLAQELSREVVFIEDYGEASIDNILKQMSSNQLILLENLEFHPGEFSLDPQFIDNIADGIDFYVNDDFESLASEQASVSGFSHKLPPFALAGGLALIAEFETLRKMKFNPAAPFAVMAGGSYSSGIVSYLQNLQSNCHFVLLTGEIALKSLALRHESLADRIRVTPEEREQLSAALKNCESRRIQVVLPVDFKLKDGSSLAWDLVTENAVADMAGLGFDSLSQYRSLLERARTIYFVADSDHGDEADSFNVSGIDAEIAEVLAHHSGDVVINNSRMARLLKALGLSEKVHHIALGRDTSNRYLEGKSLPGLDILAR
jgi:phosphoglycerate kinase